MKPGHSLPLVLAALFGAIPMASAQPKFRNPDLPVEQRVDDLLKQLTLEEKIGQTMMGSPEIKRLGIPKYDGWNEALHGVATVFPQAIGLAATWNPELHHRVAVDPGAWRFEAGPSSDLLPLNATLTVTKL